MGGNSLIVEVQRRKPVGLTGGIATGKSTVAEYFRELGAYVINGDEVAASVLVPGSPALEALKDYFGNGIILPSGELDRRVMLDILLDDPSLLATQLRILTPFILPEIDRRVSVAFVSHPRRLVVVEAPLLFEYGKSYRYHPIVVVYVPFPLQVARLMARSGRSRTWAEAVVRLQIDIEQKAEMADHLIDNSGSREDTKRSVELLYKRLSSAIE